ncbi:hypothetical protein OV203_05365 [Nannocystis sp. ILAH1]|uniref:hypothetical protein n=1 Tax=unclassified Nannocystis TaxID=2627009 RepID=UPI00227194A3|nr:MULTISPECIES: hypothetical protein [unclassified Nannocystis]MCY0986536.1 hypothetical protein [Nannocystis sp. ILAH1]MCY1071416.1 hypothetical protein [Nannocystis sp. RBIL2]
MSFDGLAGDRQAEPVAPRRAGPTRLQVEHLFLCFRGQAAAAIFDLDADRIIVGARPPPSSAG